MIEKDHMQSLHSNPEPSLLFRLRALLRGQAPYASLWRHRDFMRLWTGQTVSQFGSMVTGSALPYTAILVLHATPTQMGLLGAAGAAPLLVFGLLVGVWVDRLRRRPIMIAADLARALLLLWAPLAFLLGWLRIEQLYVLAALVGMLSVLFDVAYRSYLPTLVERERLVEGNSKLELSGAIAEVGGPPLGGALVQLISGPLTLLLDALSFVFSAFTLVSIRAAEPPPAPQEPRQHIGRDLTIGLRVVWADPLLRPIAISSTISNFFGWFFGAIYSLYAIETIGMGAAMLGLVVACGGVGALLGALLAGPATRRLGVGRTIVGALLVGAAVSPLTWLAGGAPLIAVPLMAASQLIGDAARSVALINEVSLMQTITSDRLLGRVNSVMRVLGEGIGTLGLLAGGLLAERIGLRSTVAVATAGVLVGSLWLICSPLRRLRAMPERTE
jgi:MFS family permease